MTSQEIRTLLTPPDTELSNKKALSFLNEKFNSLEDLDDFETTVQHSLKDTDDLNSQLSVSTANTKYLILETRSSAEAHLHSAQELSLLRHSLTDELSYLSRELVSSMSDGETTPTLLEDIETLHRSLKELGSVKSYLRIIQHALTLSESAVKQVHDSSRSLTETSVSNYRSLCDYVSKVSTTCLQAEDGAGQQELHLVAFVEKVRDRTWTDMKGVLSTILLAAAEKLKWPMPVDYAAASPEDRREFEASFINLLKLQEIGQKIRAPIFPNEKSERDGLYPIQTLIQPVSLRFKYHFEGSRQTNRIDKPEWYFTHILNVAHEHRPFMETVVQRLLSPITDRNIMAWREFSLLLLPLLTRKLKRTVPTLLMRPSLLAHTIYQALAFDAALSEAGFGLSETSAGKVVNPQEVEDKWGGVSEVILGNKQWFDSWMEGERKFAEDQYHEVISAPDAWLIADEDQDEEDVQRELRSTNSARRVKALVEQVTDRYSPLPHFTQRTRFLISVQLPLLEHYHSRISSSLDAFETLSSAFVRAVPGALGVNLGGGGAEGSVNVDTGKLTRGVDGVQRLCKALVSARYLGIAMESWGEDLFFLELWNEINQRASLRARAEANASLPDPTTAQAETPDGTIFEELIHQYASLSDRAEDMIVQQVCGEIEGGLKAHFSQRPDTDVSNEIALSPSLLMPIALLSSQLKFLRSALPETAFTTLYRRVTTRISEHILQRQIQYRGRHRLTPVQGKTINAECELWVETCQGALSGLSSRARVEAPWLRLLEAGRLVAAEGEVWHKLLNGTFGATEDGEWEALVEDTLGLCEIQREEVSQILRTREDCQQ